MLDILFFVLKDALVEALLKLWGLNISVFKPDKKRVVFNHLDRVSFAISLCGLVYEMKSLFELLSRRVLVRSMVGWGLGATNCRKKLFCSLDMTYGKTKDNDKNKDAPLKPFIIVNRPSVAGAVLQTPL